MNKGIFMSRYSNYSIVLESGSVTLLNNNFVDRKPSVRVQFENGMFNPYRANIGMEPKEIIKRLMDQPVYGTDYWLIDTKALLTPVKLIQSSFRELTDKEDGLLAVVDDPKMLRDAINLEKAGKGSTGEPRKTIIDALSKRLEEVLEEFKMEVENE